MNANIPRILLFENNIDWIKKESTRFFIKLTIYTPSKIYIIIDTDKDEENNVVINDFDSFIINVLVKLKDGNIIPLEEFIHSM